MVISWYGRACFKIQSGDTILVTDPLSKETGLTPPRFHAALITKSHTHPHIQTESIPDTPIIIDGPGEYEVRGIMIHGIQTYHDASEGAERGLNTAYVIELEGMRLAHLGDFGEAALSGETAEGLGSVDVLFIPVGGSHVISGKTAKKIVDQIEPRIVIPMTYAISGSKERLESADAFLREMGMKHPEAEDRLTIKKKDLPQAEETRVIVLKPSH